MDKIYGFFGERVTHVAWKSLMAEFSIRDGRLFHGKVPVASFNYPEIIWHSPESSFRLRELMDQLPEEHHGIDAGIKPDEKVVMELLWNFDKARSNIANADCPTLIALLPPELPGLPDTPVLLKAESISQAREWLLAQCPDAFIFNDFV